MPQFTRCTLPLVLLVSSLMVAGVRSVLADQRPNIVLFVTDDQSLDIGAYGNSVIKTPNMDALAAEGIRFNNAFCTTASCSASRSVILSGLHNHYNGQYGHTHSYHHFRTFDRVKTLPVRLTAAGYETIRIGKYHVAPEPVYQFDQSLAGNSRNAVAMADNVRDYLAERSSDDPFFLYICTSDPHRGGGKLDDVPHQPDAFGNRPQGYPGVERIDYDPDDVEVPSFLPDTPVCRAELAQYYTSCSRIDQGLGQLISHLKDTGHYDNTIVIFTSDHGIAFPGAKTNLYDPGMRVPMIVRQPGLQNQGKANSAMISHIDLTPTILDMAGALDDSENSASEFHGKSWAGIVDSEETEGWNKVYASHTFHEIQMYYPMKVVHGRRYKLIWNIAHQLPYPFASDLWAASTWQDRFQQGMDTMYGKKTVSEYIHRDEFELFDLQEDPHETKNLAGEEDHQALLAEMKEELKAFQESTNDPWILKWEYE